MGADEEHPVNQQRTPWHTEQWLTSAWNHDPEVVDHHFAPQVEIHDVTLPDGEQQAGVEFTADDITQVKNASLKKKDLLDEAEFTELASHVLGS